MVSRLSNYQIETAMLTCSTSPSKATALSILRHSRSRSRRRRSYRGRARGWDGGGRNGGGRNRGGTGGVSRCEVAQSEPSQDIVGLLGYSVTDALSQNSLDVGAERGARVTTERVVGRVGHRCLTNTENVGPLLDVLPEVLRIQRSVAVEDEVNLSPVQ